jgi:hypothetical protein
MVLDLDLASSVDRQTAAGSPEDEVLLARACRPAEI